MIYVTRRTNYNEIQRACFCASQNKTPSPAALRTADKSQNRCFFMLELYDDKWNAYALEDNI